VPALLDFGILALIVIVIPLRAIAERRRLQSALAAGVTDAKVQAYRRIMTWQWTAALVLLGAWLGTGRALGLLGIERPRGTGFVAGLGVALVVVCVLVVQLLATLRRPKVAEQVRAAAAPLTFILPSTQRELRLFTWLGVTAGIVEELLVRGYMLWVVGSIVPTWVAVVVTSIAFGIGHAYQGVSGIVKTTAVGLLFGWLYVLTGSIWVPMLVHAAIDVLNGHTVYAALNSGPIGGDA
jgi:membrane protease YdiL (CAAX protease family)